MSWRPIESAPNDGTEFQAWIDRSESSFWEPRCRFDEDGRLQFWGRIDYDMDGWDTYPWCPPTHWMPQPAPPSTEGGEDRLRPNELP